MFSVLLNRSCEMTSGKDLLSVVLRVRIGGQRSTCTPSSDSDRASVDSQSLVLKSRYDVRSTTSGSHGGRGGGAGAAGGAPGPTSLVRPLGRVRIIRNQDPDDMSFTLPSLRRSSDHAPEVVGDHELELGQQVQRRLHVPGKAQGQQQKGQGKTGHPPPVATPCLVVASSSGQQGGPDRSAIAANSAKATTTNSHHGQSPLASTAHGTEVDIGGQGPKTKTTTTTMFINRNQCMYIERSVPTNETPLTTQSYHSGGLLQDTVQLYKGGTVTNSGASGARRKGHHLTGPPGQQYRSSASSCTNSTTSRTTVDSSSSTLQLPRVSANTNSNTQSAGSGGSSVQSSTTPSSRPGLGARENKYFAKKLRLVKNRTKWEQDRKAVSSRASESTESGGTNVTQQVNASVRRSINLPMRIKVHLPSSTPTSNVTRERLLVEKARRDIREILRDGASGPESNHSSYSVANEPFGATPQAKLTPVLFPPTNPDPLSNPYFTTQYTTTGQHTGQSETADAGTVAIYSGVDIGNFRREVTWAAGMEAETAMLTQQYPAPPGPTTTGGSSSPVLISTHRVPLTSRAQSAHPGGRSSSSRVPLQFNQGSGHNNSRPPSPGGCASSRPTSALSTRGMPRSCSSSISDNLTASTEAELDSRVDRRRALWPSLIDVQRLKIGGFRYKNKPTQQDGSDDAGPLQARAQQQKSPQHQQYQGDSSHQESVEARTKTIVNLGTIIVPSHTCVDCPLCNLYYAKEDLWPDGDVQKHTHHDTKNDNNNNNCNNKISIRKAKSARPCRSTDLVSNDQRDEVDMSRAVTQLNREYSATSVPRTSPELEVLTPPPESMGERESEVESVTSDVKASKLKVKWSKPKEVAKGSLQKERPRSGQCQKALLARRQSCSSNVIRSSLRNPFKDFRKDGVSVTVRIPASPRQVDPRQRADYKQLMNSLNKCPVTFKFSYVKVSHSDMLMQNEVKNKPS